MIAIGVYLKSKAFVMKLMSTNLLLRKMRKFDTIWEYMDSIKGDSVLSQRILGCLPNQIHQVYLEEREEACKLEDFVKRVIVFRDQSTQPLERKEILDAWER